MMDYSELVKRLRESKKEQCYIGCFGNCGDCKIDAELEQAADAIEQLNKDLERAKEWASLKSMSGKTRWR